MLDKLNIVDLLHQRSGAQVLLSVPERYLQSVCAPGLCYHVFVSEVPLHPQHLFVFELVPSTFTAYSSHHRYLCISSAEDGDIALAELEEGREPSP